MKLIQIQWEAAASGVNDTLYSPLKKKDLIHLKSIQNCKVKHFKPYGILSWLLIYQSVQKVTE